MMLIPSQDFYSAVAGSSLQVCEVVREILKAFDLILAVFKFQWF